MSRALTTSAVCLSLLLPVSAWAAGSSSSSVAPRPREVEQRRYNTRQTDLLTNRQMRDGGIYANEQRKTDLRLIRNYIFNYKLENDYTLPTGFPTADKEICRADTSDADCKRLGLFNLYKSVKSQTPTLPIDPSSPRTSKGTGYVIRRDWRNKIYLSSPLGGPGIKEQF